jgi:hypothetical protein
MCMYVCMYVGVCMYRLLNVTDAFRFPIAIFLHPPTVLLPVLSLIHSTHLTLGLPLLLVSGGILSYACSGHLFSNIIGRVRTILTVLLYIIQNRILYTHTFLCLRGFGFCPFSWPVIYLFSF